MEKFAALITAAGASARFASNGNRPPLKKEYLPIPGGTDSSGKSLTVLGKAALAFAAIKEISVIVITVPANQQTGEEKARAALPAELLTGGCPPLLFAAGGETRRGSVHNGLSLLSGLSPRPDNVLIHDAARPWVSQTLIRAVMEAVVKYGAAIPVLPFTDTPKEIDGQGFIVRNLRRAFTAGAQTPQGFRFPGILSAHEKAASETGREFTDDAEVWGEYIGKVATVPGEPSNKKITYPEDLG